MEQPSGMKEDTAIRTTSETRSSSAGGQKKEIYTHDADWTIYVRLRRGCWVRVVADGGELL